MLMEIPMYLAHINTGALQRLIDLSILRKTRRRNQCLVRFSVLTLPLSCQSATCRVYRYSAEDRPILVNDCNLGVRFKKRSKAGCNLSAKRAVIVKRLDHDAVGTGCPEYGHTRCVNNSLLRIWRNNRWSLGECGGGNCHNCRTKKGSRTAVWGSMVHLIHLGKPRDSIRCKRTAIHRVAWAMPRSLIPAHPLHAAGTYSTILDRDDQPVLQPTREQSSCDLRSSGWLGSVRDGRTYCREARSITRHQENVVLDRIDGPKMRRQIFAPDPQRRRRVQPRCCRRCVLFREGGPNRRTVGDYRPHTQCGDDTQDCMIPIDVR